MCCFFPLMECRIDHEDDFFVIALHKFSLILPLNCAPFDIQSFMARFANCEWGGSSKLAFCFVGGSLQAMRTELNC